MVGEFTVGSNLHTILINGDGGGQLGKKKWIHLCFVDRPCHHVCVFVGQHGGGAECGGRRKKTEEGGVSLSKKTGRGVVRSGSRRCCFISVSSP